MVSLQQIQNQLLTEIDPMRTKNRMDLVKKTPLRIYKLYIPLTRKVQVCTRKFSTCNPLSVDFVYIHLYPRSWSDVDAGQMLMLVRCSCCFRYIHIPKKHRQNNCYHLKPRIFSPLQDKKEYLVLNSVFIMQV